ncbi:histone-like nucleoid-structuring protein Lsr2 [Microbacterium maritypicum]|uniref:histone-like nucleoid-structuring protein Lsr2 n=1 Tax=Microbacterium maritypicum TaxID=33918 RepID=UPI0022E194A1|nr:Lsr2 family protein [Microbacterium liquefaciens]
MARKIITSLVDDIDGSDAAETVTFALDGKAFEIDLSTANAAKLREVLAPWVDSARRVAGAAARTRTAPVRGGRADLNAVREWARGQGLKVSDRGRVSATVLEAYTKAH